MRLAMAIVLVVGGLAVLLVAGCHASPALAPVPVYDALAHRGKPDLSPWGLRPIVMLYENQFFPRDLTEAERAASEPPEGLIRQIARNLPPRSLVCVDIECWSLSKADRSETVRRFHRVVRQIKTLRPDVRVGVFGYVPPAELRWGAYLKGKGSVAYANWTAACEDMAPLAKEVDVLFPGLYPSYVRWENRLASGRMMLQAARRYGKPVYVFVSPRRPGHVVDCETAKARPELNWRMVDDRYWLGLLKLAASEADGIVVWGGYVPRVGYATWNARESWISILRVFLRWQNASLRPDANASRRAE